MVQREYVINHPSPTPLPALVLPPMPRKKHSRPYTIMFFRSSHVTDFIAPEYLRGTATNDECEPLFKQYKACLSVRLCWLLPFLPHTCSLVFCCFLSSFSLLFLTFLFSLVFVVCLLGLLSSPLLSSALHSSLLPFPCTVKTVKYTAVLLPPMRELY